MENIRIKPIFDQSAPGVWRDFAHIHAAARFPDDDIDALARTECKLMCKMSTNWKKKRGCKYAFAAYDARNNMVGFILGYAMARCGCVDSLFVLPKYHGHRIGRQLLSLAEYALSVVASSVELVSLENAMTFYESRGYRSCLYSNHYIKSLNGYSRCAFVPVFCVSASLNRQCRDINPDFDKSVVNRLHQPMVAHFDEKSCLDGYIGAGTNIPCLRDGSTQYVKSILQSKLNEYTCNR